jgi:hypothetical protein
MTVEAGRQVTGASLNDTVLVHPLVALLQSAPIPIEGLWDISRVRYPCLCLTTGYDSITSFTETIMFGDNGPP